MPKFKYSATTPDGAQTTTRGSDRVYTHALAVWFDAKKRYEETRWVHGENGAEAIIPAGLEVIGYGWSGNAEDRRSAHVGRRVEDEPAHWAIVSFHGSAPLAAKAAGQRHLAGRRHQVVPVEVAA
ncbi:hypothetical protein MTY66_62440 (plasmid) [Mycolicibacterium sp. TY66]|jgi:hypothetical protein|uniref:hypothetical protein n=1 Tax=unclassified Mycolicibacterium TaxID=2636767 RepID=UPI001BB39A1D|nr:MULTISPECIES: hypothetical protein [unclassified Mycolicibacterium]BCI84619.1 hypothetical protein MTY66_62440 [Mycolicibacterium sp. TY66]BCJ84849.1 hypothetical protein MTY81_62220 [Mycolicibacterium sp. TY81]